MIKVAIIEDDKVYIDYLKNLLVRWPGEKTKLEISGFTDGHEFLHTDLDIILTYDIVFIDIELLDFNGIELAAKLRNMGFCNTIVFATNYEKYAIKGYTVNAFRYYLKPLKARDINECMNFVLDFRSKEHFQYFYHGMTNQIPFQNIICFESMQHYMNIYTKDSIIQIKHSLKKALEQTPSYFIRCHRSFIINEHYIKRRTGNQLILMNGKKIEISRIYSKAVTFAMNNREKLTWNNYRKG